MKCVEHRPFPSLEVRAERRKVGTEKSRNRSGHGLTLERPREFVKRGHEQHWGKVWPCRRTKKRDKKTQ